MNTNNSSSFISRKHLEIIGKVFFFSYLLILFFLNFIRIFDNAFWGDECYTIRLIQMDFPEMIKTTANNVHPPLYYIILHLFYQITGDSPVMYHFVSLIPYIILMIFSITKLRKDYGILSSVLFATLISLQQNALVYNVEVRMYSWAALFVFFSFYSLRSILKENTILAWVLFVIFSLGAAYTHYYALITVAFFYIALLVIGLKNKNTFKRIMFFGIVTVIAYLPWLCSGLSLFTRSLETYHRFPLYSIMAYAYFIFDNLWTIPVWFLFLLLFFLYELQIIKPGKSLKNMKFSKPSSITSDTSWFIIGLITVGGYIILSLIVSYLIRPMFIPRYAFPATVVMWLILSISASRLNYKQIIIPCWLIILLCLKFPSYHDFIQSERNLGQATEYFLETVHPSSDSLILTNSSDMTWTVLEYYYPTISRTLVTEDTLNLENFQNNDDIWLFWMIETYKDTAPTPKTLDYFKRNGYSVETIFNGDGGFATTATSYVYHLTKS